MIYPFENYQKHELGYWLKSYAQNGGNIDRKHTLVDLSGSDFSGESYALESWFAELKKSSGARDFCGNSSGGVVQCATANSNFDNTMLKRHAHKEIQPDLMDTLAAMEKAGASDQIVNSMMRNYLKSVFNEHAEGFKRIWTVINEKYDPLFNVDVEDIEKHTGSDTDTHTGTDTTTKSGNDALAHTGTNALAKSGTVAVAHTGKDTDTHSGTDTVTNDGDDSKTTSGSIENEKSGTETTADGANSGSTTNNSSFVFDSVAAVPENTSDVDLHTEKSLSFSNRKDTQSYNNLKEQTDYNSTHETEYDTTTERDYNSTETTTNNTTDTTTFNDTATTTYNSGNEIEYDTESKSTYNSTITRTKKGNQGITMSQEMLEREIESWSNIDYLKYVVDTVAHEIVLW